MPITHFGPFVLDSERRQLIRDSVPIELPKRSFDLLVLLLVHPGRVFRRDELFELLWHGDLEASDSALNQTVSVLRRALGDSAGSYLRTVPRVGYTFNESVPLLRVKHEEAPGANTGADAEPTQSSEPHSEPKQVSESKAESRHGNPRALRERFWPIAATAMMLLLTLGVWMSTRSTDDHARAMPLHLTLNLDEQAAATLWVRAGVDELIRGRFDTVADNADTKKSSVALLNGRVGLEGRVEPRTVVIDWQLRIHAAAPTHWRQHIVGDRLYEITETLESALRARGVIAIRHHTPAALSDAALTTFADGLRAFERMRYPQARIAFSQALQLAPDFAVAEAELARTLEKLGLNNLAIAHARAAQQKMRADSSARSLLQHRLCLLLNDFAGSIRVLERLVHEQPAEIEWRLLLATSHVLNADPGAARVELETLDPKQLAPAWRIRWLQTMAYAQTQSGETANAIVLLHRAVELAQFLSRHELEATSRSWLADSLARGGDILAASAQAQQAERLFVASGDLQNAFQARSLWLQAASIADLNVADAEYQALIAMASRSGNENFEAMADATWGFALRNSSRFTEAIEVSTRAMQRFRGIGAEPIARQIELALVDLQLLAGTVSAASALMKKASGSGQRGLATPWLHAILMHEILAAEGDFAAANVQLDMVVKAGNDGNFAAGRNWECAQARLNLLTGEIANARKLLDQCDQTLRRFPGTDSEYWLPRAAATRAVLEHWSGAPRQARAALENASALAFLVNDNASGQMRVEIAAAQAFVGDPAEASKTIAALINTPPLNTAPRLRAVANVFRCIAQARENAEKRDACSAAQAEITRLGDADRALLALASAPANAVVTIDLIEPKLKPLRDRVAELLRR
jgi:DNA-binding winged helix-turn-helix (wHTH) protein